MMKAWHVTLAIGAIVQMAVTSAQAPTRVRTMPRRTPATLVIDAPASVPAVARRDARLPALTNAARLKLAISAGMPHTFSLSKAPITLSARRMFVDGAARIDSSNGHFVTNPQYDYLQIDTKGKSLDIHFNVAKPNTYVLVLVRGWAAHPGSDGPYGTVPYLKVPGSDKKVEAELAEVIPFVVQCQQAGWHQVTFSLSGLDLSGLGATNSGNFFVVRSIELSTFS